MLFGSIVIPLLLSSSEDSKCSFLKVLRSWEIVSHLYFHLKPPLYFQYYLIANLAGIWTSDLCYCITVPASESSNHVSVCVSVQSTIKSSRPFRDGAQNTPPVILSLRASSPCLIIRIIQDLRLWVSWPSWRFWYLSDGMGTVWPRIQRREKGQGYAQASVRNTPGASVRVPWFSMGLR